MHSNMRSPFSFFSGATARAADANGYRRSCWKAASSPRSLRRGLQLLASHLLLVSALHAAVPSGFELVRSFGFPEGMGDMPSAGLILGSDQKLYGTTVEGGTNANNGVVYSMQNDGTGYTVLHH